MRVRTAVLGVVGVSAALEYQRARKVSKVWQRPAGEHRRAGALAVRTLGESGSPVLLLHGLVASGVFWGGAYDRLAEHHRLVVPDLLGFGGSDRTSSGYGPDEHVDALIECLDHLGIRQPVTIGAHSLGCLVALRMAATHPDRVAGIIGFGAPLYRDRASAKARIGASGPMAQLFALPGPVAELACRWVCAHRRMAGRLAVLTNPRLPAPVAADGVQHNWTSYSQTMNRVILDAGAAEWIETVDASLRFVAGDDDNVVDRPFLMSLSQRHPGIAVEIRPGRHDLPLVQAGYCVSAIIDFLRSGMV